jgi:hypothetical protein
VQRASRKNACRSRERHDTALKDASAWNAPLACDVLRREGDPTVTKWEQQLERVRRYRDRVERLYGGEVLNRPNEELLDDVHAFFQNCYHLKDWLKNDSSYTKHASQEIEDFVTNTPELALCADICNALKHLILQRARSGQAHTFQPTELIIDLEDSLDAPAEPAQTRIAIRAFIEHGDFIHDVRDLARTMVSRWETFVS